LSIKGRKKGSATQTGKTDEENGGRIPFGVQKIQTGRGEKVEKRNKGGFGSEVRENHQYDQPKALFRASKRIFRPLPWNKTPRHTLFCRNNGKKQIFLIGSKSTFPRRPPALLGRKKPKPRGRIKGRNICPVCICKKTSRCGETGFPCLGGLEKIPGVMKMKTRVGQREINGEFNGFRVLGKWCGQARGGQVPRGRKR